MKKLTAFVLSFVIAVFAFCTPVYAATYPDFLAIAAEQGIGTTTYAIFEDDNYYYYIDTVARVTSSGNIDIKNTFTGVYDSYYYQKIDKKNPYIDWEYNYVFSSQNFDVVHSGIHLNTSTVSYLFSSYDIVMASDTSNVVFMQTPFKKGTMFLSSTLPSVQLSGVLNECITVLPVLLPVLIALIAIRKGLAFTLTMLRAA